MTVAAAVLAGLAMLLWRPAGGWLLRHRLGLGRQPSASPRLFAVVVGVAVLAVPALPALSLPRVLVVGTIVGVSVFAARGVRSGRRRERAAECRRDVAEAIVLMAAELRAGILPQRSLVGLAEEFAFLCPAARASDLGGDVSAALRSSATAPGCGLLGDLAGAWVVADRSGAPLARVLERLGDSARADQEIEREVQSGLAPARATGRLMAVLPVVGLALGSGMGGDPLGVLIGTVPGALCLVAGAALGCAGIAWVDHIAESAERDE